MPALVRPYTVRATSNSERPEHLGERVEIPRAVHRGEHLPLERHQVQRVAALLPRAAGSRGTSRRCETFEPMRDHSSIRRAASISSASVGKRTGASTAAW